MEKENYALIRSWQLHDIRVGLLAEIQKRKLAKYAHWKRRGESLVLAAVEGEPPGKRKRGRRRIEWHDNIREWTEGGMQAAQAAVVPTCKLDTAKHDICIQPTPYLHMLCQTSYINPPRVNQYELKNELK